MKTVCEKDTCVGCMACVESCPTKAISIKDDLSAYNAVIDEEKCIHCNACHQLCQNNREILFIKPKKWYQGWANDAKTRQDSSSGGLAASIATAFIEKGGVVFSCAFGDGIFGFCFAENKEELKKFKGSKYVKSNAQSVYKKIRELLNNGKQVLFIGLPCQVSALKILVGEKLQENLYTIDLICHGTPSPQLLNIFLRQYGVDLKNIENISFRKKHSFCVATEKELVYPGTTDRYSLAFLDGLIYTDNCYECKYAQEERVSDLTLGDSWGSELSEEEKRKGVSLILCQTEKGESLLRESNVCLLDVNQKRAIAFNHQLERPTSKSNQRKKFFKLLQKKSFNKSVFFCMPKRCVKQTIKKILFTIGIKKSNGGGYRITVFYNS